jgi:RNA polymerase sigma factor (sigma-70 family)
MSGDHTTVVVQRYLDAIATDQRADTLVRELLDQAVRRLHMLCTNLLHRSYPRLTRPPLNVSPEELLSAVVERLLKALRAVRPGNVRQFFGLANQHMRWELNDLARNLDNHPPPQPIGDGTVPAPSTHASALTPIMSRMLAAIDQLPADEREAFSLVRIQGLSHGEAAEVLSVSTKTVQRRLNRSLLLLVEALHDLRPGEPR